MRRTPGKEYLTVIDYIGNHRTFLIKTQTLFQLGPGDHEILNILERARKGELDLPPGCEVTYELEAIAILKSLLRISTEQSLVRYYEEFRERTGARPLIAEAYHDGYNPRSLRRSHGSWFRFVRSMGDLSQDETRILADIGDFLDSLETTEMTRSFKMLVLLAMLKADRFPGEIGVTQLAEGFAELAGRSATLQSELGEALHEPEALRRLLEQNPIAAWVGGKGTGGRKYFVYENGVFRTTFDIPEGTARALQNLVRELASWRLAEYLGRSSASGASQNRIVCNVSHARRRPILFLPDRKTRPDIPEGWRDVIADGVTYQANFVKVAVMSCELATLETSFPKSYGVGLARMRDCRERTSMLLSS